MKEFRLNSLTKELWLPFSMELHEISSSFITEVDFLGLFGGGSTFSFLIGVSITSINAVCFSLMRNDLLLMLEFAIF